MHRFGGGGWEPEVDPNVLRTRRRLTQRAMVRAGLTLVLLVGLYFVIPLDEGDWPFGLVVGFAAVGAVVPLTLRRVRAINGSDQPMADAVEAVALLLGLVVVGFASINYGMAVHTDQIPNLHTKIDSLYFTVVSIATIGYGDITPTGQLSRVIVTLEIVINFTLLALSLKLVSGVAQYRQRTRGISAQVAERFGLESDFGTDPGAAAPGDGAPPQEG